MRTATAILLILCLLLPAAATAADADYKAFRKSADKALAALENALDEQRASVYVWREAGDSQNHFTQKAKIFGSDETLVEDMDENWRENPAAGRSCIRCCQTVEKNDWGGWIFLNGWLPEGETTPQLNDGSVEGQGLDLTGTQSLTFMARGEKGGEKVEFYTCGFGRDEKGRAVVPYPDSAEKKSLGTVTLTKNWKEYTIKLKGMDMSSVACGFGYVAAGGKAKAGTLIFYLDEIRFRGDYSDRPCFPLLRSYDTGNTYIQNAAFSYDNAVTAMAFLSAGKKAEAEEVLNALVFAVESDRYKPGRVRNAYASADIISFPGWDGAARLPGWYDTEKAQWLEDRYQTGSNVGNTAYVALALLQYDALYSSEKYLATARQLMDWVLETCTDGGDGFTAGYDGWPEAGPENTYVFTYKSIEHNIDAFAAFRQLYARTGEQRYLDAAYSALKLIRAMYDPEIGGFCIGTGNDGKTVESKEMMLDAQVWCCMALGETFADYEPALKIVESMRQPDGGYPFCLENKNGGWWAEGTAYTALMYRLRGEDRTAAASLKALEKIQLDSGLFPAATVPDLSTGLNLFDGTPWEYGDEPHITPTAWYVMAVNRFNPYTFPGNAN